MYFEVLKKVANGLNRIDVTWAIGASSMLNFYDIVKKPSDIDILINPKDKNKVINFMNTLGEYGDLPDKEPFRTEEFFYYKVDGINVEFLGGFKIKLENDSIYEFILDEVSIKKGINFNGIKVNLTTLEDWFVAYSVMNDPKKRVPLIKDYLKDKKIDEFLLMRNLNQDLTIDIKNDILTLITY